MIMSEKIERSRVNAREALEAYRATGRQDPDDVTCIGDLIADLLHLADACMTEAEAEEGCEVAWDGAISAPGLLDRALEHFMYERDPEHADEGV